MTDPHFSCSADIVERIRTMTKHGLAGYHDPAICGELTSAADEIERLRRVVSFKQRVDRLRGQSGGVAQGQQEPVVWASFTESGYVRFWTTDKNRAVAEMAAAITNLKPYTVDDLMGMVVRASAAQPPSETAASTNRPSHYRRLPDGVRCRCVKLWTEADGSYWCCNPKSQAKEPEASGGLCAVASHAVRVGEAGADQPATSEHMDVTAGETAPHFRSSADSEEQSNG